MAVSRSLALLLGLGVAVPVFGAELPLPTNQAPIFLVIYDLRTIEPGEVTSSTEGDGAVSFPMSEINQEQVACSAVGATVPLKRLKAYVECAIGHHLAVPDFNATDAPTLNERQFAAQAIAASLVELRKSASPRAISRRGSYLVAVALQTAEFRTIVETVTPRCLDPGAAPEPQRSTTYEIVFGRKPQFAIAEVARKSQIESDFNGLLTLALKITQGPKAAPPPPIPCQKRADTATYTSDSKAITWSSGHAIPLALKRATVTLDGSLPASAAQLIGAEDPKKAAEVVKLAAEFLRLEALRQQEAEDLKLFDTCPAVDPGRLDSLQHVVCALDKATTVPSPSSIAAVQALSKMATPRRATFLRWALEHKSGELREQALVALAQVAPPAPAQPPAPGKEAKQTIKFLSGPLEHWSISADVFTTRKTLWKRDDSGLFVLDETPPIFYASLNFLFGDLPSTERKGLQNVELKWLLQASKSPFDSVGFGIGLRGSYAKRFGLDFDLLSPFGALTWTQPEDSSQSRVLQARVGVSLNINKALDWVK